MSGVDDEGGDAPCWAHEFEDELFGDGAGPTDGEQDPDETESDG